MSRTMSVTYGLFAYAIFLVCAVYAIGFIGNFGVPKSIDSGQTGAFWPSMMINAALLSLFAVQHTGMARKSFKRWWTEIVPSPIERSTYVLVSSAVLILLYWQWRPLPGVVWNVENPVGRAALLTMFASGWLMFLAASFMIHHFDLFGLRQVWLHMQGKPYSYLGFRTPGIYQFMRHPIQVGFLLAFWSTPTMTVGHLLFSILTTGYIFVAVKFFEERDLVRVFGDTYRDSREQVYGFLPLSRYRSPRPSAKPMAESPVPVAQTQATA